MIVATADAAGASEPGAFDLLAQRVPATILRCGDNAEELRLASARCAIRLSIISGTLLRGSVRLSFHLSATCLPTRLRALRAFYDLMRHGLIPLQQAASGQGTRRMAMVLATMDGLARGWSQRDIAIALFGERIVASDWGGSSDFLKSRVRRLIAQVAHLSRESHLSLLQESPGR